MMASVPNVSWLWQPDILQYTLNGFEGAVLIPSNTQLETQATHIAFTRNTPLHTVEDTIARHLTMQMCAIKPTSLNADAKFYDILSIGFDEQAAKIQANSHVPIVEQQTRTAQHTLSMICTKEKSDFNTIKYKMIPAHQVRSMPKDHIESLRKIVDTEKEKTTQEYPRTAAGYLWDSVQNNYEWAKAYISHHFGHVHPFQTYNNKNNMGLFDMTTGDSIDDPKMAVSGGRVTIALASDWAAGTLESDLVANAMMRNAPDWTLHIGDIYFVGSEEEVQSNMLGEAPEGVKKGVKWPIGRLGSFALEGNHEMFSRGFGYFDALLPTLGRRNSSGITEGQQASYFALFSKDWRVIGLDSGYNTYSLFNLEQHDNPQPQPVIDWLHNVVNLDDPDDLRGIVFLIHHQHVSAFVSPTYRSTPEQLIREGFLHGKKVLFLFGHEHRWAAYAEQEFTLHDVDGNRLGNFTHHARCIGNSGFPPLVAAVPTETASSKLLAYDARLYQNTSSLFELAMGFNGWTELTLEGSKLHIEYITLSVDADGFVSDQRPSKIASEEFIVSNTGDIELIELSILEPSITVVDQA